MTRELNTKAAHFNRPGVSDASLAAAGCAHVGGEECARRYGFKAEGIAIPFRTLGGDPIIDGETPFARVRIYHATDDQKYHQRPESCCHVYIPPNFANIPKGSTLVLVEGEFKAASLAEAGFAALGLSGLNGACRTLTDGDGRTHALNDELIALLEIHRPARLVFLGDADVTFNAQFAAEAAKLRKLVRSTQRFSFVANVLAAKPPVDGPKGIDDCRAQHKDGFNAWFEKLLTNAFDIPAKATAAELFAEFLRRETETISKLLSTEGHEARRARVKLLHSAAQLWNEPGAKLELKPLLSTALGVKQTEIAGLIRDAASDRKVQTRQTQRSTRGARTSAGQSGHTSTNPSQWFSEKFPSLAGEFGDAILEETDQDGIISARDIGEDFLAATLGDKASPDAPTVFLPAEDKFYTYRPSEGILALVSRLSEMSEVIKWQGGKVDVQARLVPRFLWNTASIDVFLDGECILRTGGQMKFTGSHSTTFTHSGSTHTAELSWGRSGLTFSLPYRLRIDDVPIAASRVHIQNWRPVLIAAILLGAVLGLVLGLLPSFGFFHLNK